MTDVGIRLKQQARALGFAASGVAALDASEHGAALDAWLAAGFAGTMRYLHRQAAKRKAPAGIVPGARVAVMVLENYAAPRSDDSARPGVRVAAYARGTDYHLAMRTRLDALAAWLLAEGATIARPFVDAGPVPERELAARAGLGWIGKNTMLIRPQAGSLFFLGAIFTDLDLSPDQPFRTDHCGTCTRCLDACPTDAFVAPRVLDATRCLSYLTIELKGPHPAELAGTFQGWAFGCDVCNDVCPWNERFAMPTPHAEYARRPDPDTADPAYFADMDRATFTARFADTPLERPGLEGMRRNWETAFNSLRDRSDASPDGT